MAWRSPPSSNPVSPILLASASTGHGLGITPLSLNMDFSMQPLTLVIPTICVQKLVRRAEVLSPKTGRPYPNRLRAHKPAHSNSFDVVPPPSMEDNWVAPLGKFDIEQDSVELEGYQMYAVEKWVVDRSRFMKVVVVYTGDPRDIVIVTVITPASSLTNEEAQTVHDEAARLLRRDGAKPKLTALGVIMTTSLANFRSDLNIVKIPGGNYLEARDKLYVNINLLRLGCSGRTALTLEHPSEAVQERFRQMYSIPAIAIQRLNFSGVMLEFIKLIQSALVIFDLFDISEERDGLLCDTTVESIQKWTLNIGEQLQELRLEPTERILDPTVVAAILSVVASMRSKLIPILPAGTPIPKDPFQYPKSFAETLALVCPSQVVRQTPPNAPPRAFLNAVFVDHINRQFKRKILESKTHRLNPSSLVSLLPTDPFSGPVVGVPKSPVDSTVSETSDLIAFSKSSSVTSKDPIESLQLVWTGKLGPVLSHAKHAQELEERRAAEERDAENKSDARSGEDDEGLLNKGIYAIKQRGQEISSRLPSLPSLPGAIASRKKQSIDASSSLTLFPPSISSSRLSPDFGSQRSTPRSETYPSPEDFRALSADEGFKRSHRPFLRSIGSLTMHPPIAYSYSNSAVPTTSTPVETRQKTKSFDLHHLSRSSKRPKLWKHSEQWIIPPSTMEPEMQSDDDTLCHRMRKSRFHPTNVAMKKPKTIYSHDDLKRRHSFDVLDQWRDVPCLPAEQMKLDVQFVNCLNELERRTRRLNLATEAIKELIRPLVITKEIMEHRMKGQQPSREELDRKVDNILPAVADLAAIRMLQLQVKELSHLAFFNKDTFKLNAISAAEMLNSSKYKASSEIQRIPELKSEVRKHREQFWQQRRLAYLPPEAKKDDEDLTLSLGSKCPFLWSLQALYKLMLLTVFWAGMVRRGEIQPNVDDGWRRSTVFGTKLDRKGRTQADLDMLIEEENDQTLEWTMKAPLISAQSFAPL